MPGPYSRVYHSIKDDPRFEHVWHGDAALATWLRLLIEADASYPAPASIPRSCRPLVLGVLVNAGLVELLPHDMYRIHGLEAERKRRAEQGLPGANARWGAMRTHSERNANAYGHAMPDETRLDKTRRAGAGYAPITNEQNDRAIARLGAGEFTTYAEALEAVRAEK